MVKHLKENEKYKELVGMITCIFAVNLIVLIFANVNYATETFEFRYHLISMIPMILLTSIAASDLWEKRKLLEQTIVLVTIVLLLFVNVYDYKNYMRDCYNDQGDMQGITLTAEQEGVHLIITIGSPPASLRLTPGSHHRLSKMQFFSCLRTSVSNHPVFSSKASVISLHDEWNFNKKKNAIKP